MPLNLKRKFTISWIAQELCSIGGISIPILSKSTRELLAAEALTYTYKPRPKVYGPAKVHQEVSAADIHAPSIFFTLRDEWQNLFTDKLQRSPWANLLFPTPLDLNSPALQRYEAGSLGIRPHRDKATFINVICIFILMGRSKFAICSNHEGDNAIELDSSPGNVIILRAPGFMEGKCQPIHAVSDIPETRITFTLRQLQP